MNQRVVVCTVALGGWYHRGVARMIENFHAHSPGYELRAFVNVLPFGAPANVIEGNYDYTAYCAKPFALLDALHSQADIAILIDAAFYPIRSIISLVEYIHREGYYLCDNGFTVAEYSSDRCLERMGLARRQAREIPEITSYCVGLNFGDGRCVDLLHRWCGFAGDRLTIPAPHDNQTRANFGRPARNKGFVSTDQSVKGHRHDQTVLSVLAHRLKMDKLVERPRFTAYAGSETEETVLVNLGLG